MKKNRKLVQQAKNLSSSDLYQILLLHSDLHLLNNYHFEIQHAGELSNECQEEIIQLFEINMKRFYEQSKDGYNRDEKKKELFANQSRYLRISSTDCLIAFGHFRFDMDYDHPVLYLYELQVNMNYQGQGLGQWLIKQMKILCEKCQMVKIVLTVHKANKKAVEFYMKKCQFAIDITNSSNENLDYLILSFSV